MFILIFILFIVLLYVYDRYRVRKLPPSINGGLPIVGHSILLLTKNIFDIVTSTVEYALETKTELLTVRLGLRDIYLIMNPDDAFNITNSSLEKDEMYSFLHPFLGNGLFTAPVPIWKVHRKLLNPTFNQRVLDGYLKEFNSQTRYLMETLADKAGKGPFNHTSHMLQTSLHILCATSMGSCNDKREMETRKLFTEMLQGFLDAMTERVVKFWLQSDFINWLSGHKKHMDMLADQMKVLTKTILEKKRAELALNRNQNDSEPKRSFKPFIDHLLELSENELLTEQEIRDELNTFITAGTDTLAVGFSNLLTHIGSDSAVQDRILEELQEVFGGSDRDVEKQDLSKLNYLEAVIKETLRIYPPGIIAARVLDKDVTIKGYTLPAGSKCIILLYGLLRHWSWGPDADQFRPERWLDGSLPHNMKGFAAFGLGKRNCIGYNFSIMGLKTILAIFLRRYSIKSDITHMVQEFSVTAKPISGHEIAIEER